MKSATMVFHRSQDLEKCYPVPQGASMDSHVPSGLSLTQIGLSWYCCDSSRSFRWMTHWLIELLVQNTLELFVRRVFFSVENVCWLKNQAILATKNSNVSWINQSYFSEVYRHSCWPRHLHRQAIWRPMKKSMPLTNHSAVRCVARHSHRQAIWRPMKKSTPLTNHSAVQSVARHSHRQAIW